MRRSVGTLRRPASLLAVLALVGLLGLAPSSPATAAGEDATAPEYSRTQTLTRVHVGADGTETAVEEREVTVTVDHTQSLRGRERVQVTWSGAHPSGGRTPSPYGFDGMNQEYPVVILQCRGLDDPTLPVAQQLQPETCWTTTYLQRYASVANSAAVWRHDRFASEEDRASQDAVKNWPAACDRLPSSFLSQHLLPFHAAKGTVYPACSDTTIAPESSIDAALPAAEVAAFTGADGTGEMQFEVRTATENESLGCSFEVPCSIVVIPIMGISCMDQHTACRKEGNFEPGSSNFSNLGVSDAVSPRYWWSESNWRGRFSVPLTFGLPPDACDVLDDRVPVDMFGSELLSQASLQWAPAYCLRADRFKFRHNRMPESAALRLLASGEGVAAFVSDEAETSAVPLGYAPIAVTGFAVAYVADRPDNAGEVEQLRLNPRLLAKLLTQSYPASFAGRAHPGLETNPISLNTDPEFIELNPGLSSQELEAAATVLSLSEASDVMSALTSYIAADADATAFVAGEADPWGMTVNPAYEAIELPRHEWPLLDSWTLHSGGCTSQTPYLTRVAAPVNSLRKIAESVLDAWPNVQTRCTPPVMDLPERMSRLERQSYGSRLMLGIVSLGDAERYGLRTAELATEGSGAAATFVGPSQESMEAALVSATQSAPGAPFLLDRTDLDADAYPGTMIVHATARLTGLQPADAAPVALLIKTATTEGQAPGSGNGQLAGGYLPITSAGATGPLFASAQAVADAIAAQRGPIVAPVTPTTPQAPPVPTSAGLPLPQAPPSVGAPAGSLPLNGLAATDGAVVNGLPAPQTAAAVVPVVTRTPARSVGFARAVIPSALGVSLLGGIGAPALWAWSTRRRLS